VSRVHRAGSRLTTGIDKVGDCRASVTEPPTSDENQAMHNRKRRERERERERERKGGRNTNTALAEEIKNEQRRRTGEAKKRHRTWKKREDGAERRVAAEATKRGR